MSKDAPLVPQSLSELHTTMLLIFLLYIVLIIVFTIPFKSLGFYSKYSIFINLLVIYYIDSSPIDCPMTEIIDLLFNQRFYVENSCIETCTIVLIIFIFPYLEYFRLVTHT